MLIFKTKIFHKWCKKLKIGDNALCKAIEEVATGQYDAFLGGSIYKKRVAIGNRGKSAGVRTIIALKKEGRAFFIYGYAKNVRANINEHEKSALSKFARDLFLMNENEINKMINSGKLIQVK